MQKSVFLGTLAETERDELVLGLEALIDDDRGLGLHLPDVPARLLQGHLLGQAFDEKLVCDEVRCALDLRGPIADGPVMTGGRRWILTSTRSC